MNKIRYHFFEEKTEEFNSDNAHHSRLLLLFGKFEGGKNPFYCGVDALLCAFLQTLSGFVRPYSLSGSCSCLESCRAVQAQTPVSGSDSAVGCRWETLGLTHRLSLVTGAFCCCWSLQFVAAAWLRTLQLQLL